MIIEPTSIVPAYNLQVYVDGERFDDVFYVDTVNGYIKRYTDRFNGERIIKYTYGDITFKIVED